MLSGLDNCKIDIYFNKNNDLNCDIVLFNISPQIDILILDMIYLKDPWGTDISPHIFELVGGWVKDSYPSTELTTIQELIDRFGFVLSGFTQSINLILITDPTDILLLKLKYG